MSVENFLVDNVQVDVVITESGNKCQIKLNGNEKILELYTKKVLKFCSKYAKT